MNLTEETKTVVQCDFDGTVTELDISFQLLDHFADGDWRQLLNEYIEGKIPVGTFNRMAFAMVKADKQTMLDFIFNQSNTKVRPGFDKLLAYCSNNGFKFVIVSNGLDFYIEALLKDMGVEGIEVYAAKTRFNPGGLQVAYIGPDGSILEKGFKDAYTDLFLSRGYHVVYVGNGISDSFPAKKSHHVFATGDLLTHCRENNIVCTPFNDLNEVARGLELLGQG